MVRETNLEEGSGELPQNRQRHNQAQLIVANGVLQYGGKFVEKPEVTTCASYVQALHKQNVRRGFRTFWLPL